MFINISINIYQDRRFSTLIDSLVIAISVNLILDCNRVLILTSFIILKNFNWQVGYCTVNLENVEIVLCMSRIPDPYDNYSYSIDIS